MLLEIFIILLAMTAGILIGLSQKKDPADRFDSFTWREKHSLLYALRRWNKELFAKRDELHQRAGTMDAENGEAYSQEHRQLGIDISQNNFMIDQLEKSRS